MKKELYKSDVIVYEGNKAYYMWFYYYNSYNTGKPCLYDVFMAWLDKTYKGDYATGGFWGSDKEDATEEELEGAYKHTTASGCYWTKIVATWEVE